MEPLSVRTALMSWTALRPLRAAVTAVTTGPAASHRPSCVMESETVWMALMKMAVVSPLAHEEALIAWLKLLVIWRTVTLRWAVQYIYI